MVEHDCLIVGAGFVGAALGIALSRRGLSVAVIDGRSPLTDVSVQDARGIALSPSSRQLLESLELWSAIESQIEVIKHIRVTEMGRLPSVDLSSVELGLDALAYVVPADHLLRSIEQNLVEQSKVMWRTTLESIEHNAAGVVANMHSHTGELLKVRAKFIVGADGLNSKVRQLANISATVRDYRQQAVVATIAVEGAQAHTAHERFTAQGPVALLPSVNARHVAVRCCALDEVDRLLGISNELFIEELQARFARPVGRLHTIGERRAHPLVLSQANNIVDRNLALIGAAAVTVHPNGAQGLNLGLRDVADLSSTLVALLSGTAVHSNEDILAAYSTRRVRDHRSVIRFTDRLASGFSSTLPGMGIARALGMIAAQTFPWVRHKLMYQGMGLNRPTSRLFSEESAPVAHSASEK